MQLLLARLIGRTRLSWYRFTALVCLALVALAFGTASLDGTLGEIMNTDDWRTVFFYPALIAYILAIIPPLMSSGDRALEALRPLVALDDEGFAHLLDDTFAISPRGELIAFGLGAALGVWSLFPWIVTERLSWMTLYFCVAIPLEIGMLGWCVYVAFAGTKPIAVVHRHLQDVDILDVDRFEPIGRQSLLGSLAFIGGAAIHLFFQVGGEHIFGTVDLIVYGALAAIAALIFFLSMRQTHRVLAEAKDREQQAVQRHIVDAYRSLEGLPTGSPDIASVSQKLDLWQAYERRLKGVRTWPYNLGMLRTLVLSVFTPVAINLVQRLIAELLG
jgi:hypothetical protein